MNRTLLTKSARRVQVPWLCCSVYACFFLSGATALIFEILWSRQFVTVFGNSSYAISIVLCAYMAGLGLGGLIGGRLADRMTRQMTAYGAVQAAIGVWALAIPLLLPRLRSLVPALPALSPDSLLVSTLARFALSFAILVLPCFLMGTTLPLLVRAVVKSDQFIGKRVGALYCWNTLGAAFGCLVAGFWMIDTLGLRMTNLLAAGVSFVVALAAFALSQPLFRATNPALADAPQSKPARRRAAPEPPAVAQVPGALLLSTAFLNGLASLACEVLWIRYLAFLNQEAYVFPTILCIYLLGLGLGGLIYGLLAGKIHRSAQALGFIEVLLAISVLATFAASGLLFASGPPRPLDLKGMAFATVFAPTVLMGVAFPLLCSAYGRQVQMLGRRIGLLFALNTAGTVFGSLLPLFVLVPSFGIQKSLLLISVLYGGMGLTLLAFGAEKKRRLNVLGTAICVGVWLLFLVVVPSNLCQRVFLATDFNLARHTDILFYHEGRTGTAIVTRNRVSASKTLYINGVSEVPISYAHEICFKMLGDLGPMLHANPDNVLMICFGGGIAAGTTTCLPDVKSLTVVDLESSVVEAARSFAKENNNVLQNPKMHVVIDDGRNYVMTARRKWPVIISDSTHPKFGDSWVLYTQEFYRLVCEHLTDDGVFVQWVPRHDLSAAEFKIIMRTFQSVFPHASLWVSHGMDAEGRFVSYSLLASTPKPLKIDVAKLRDRLGAEPVRADLEPYGLDTPAGFLDAFVCAEDALRSWVGEGPINTDDLPYTQYQTRYSKGSFMNAADFIEPMEDIWPYLTGTGSEESAEQLRHELALHAKVNRLAFLGRTMEAYSVLPEEKRFRQMRSLCESEPRYIQGLLDIYWNNPQALVFLACARFSGLGGPNAVQPILTRVLELDPKNMPALNMLGGLHSDGGDLKGAEDYLTRALALDPKSVAVHYNLGLMLDRSGRHTEALEQWRTAAALASKDAAVPVTKDMTVDAMAADQWGKCLAEQGHVEQAITVFNSAIEMEPTFVPAKLDLATLLAMTGHTKEALTQVRYVMKLDPENKAVLGLLEKIEGRNIQP